VKGLKTERAGQVNGHPVICECPGESVSDISDRIVRCPDHEDLRGRKIRMVPLDERCSERRGGPLRRGLGPGRDTGNGVPRLLKEDRHRGPDAATAGQENAREVIGK
jgi:hypothetical protein